MINIGIKMAVRKCGKPETCFIFIFNALYKNRKQEGGLYTLAVYCILNRS